MIPSVLKLDFIAHEQQRYPTVGDWFVEDGVLWIRVSRTEDQRHQWLVALHEIVESVLCLLVGVDPERADAFDHQWERDVKAGKESAEDEPGDSRRAPYHRQHVIATLVERACAMFLGVDWAEYEAQLGALWNSTRDL